MKLVRVYRDATKAEFLVEILISDSGAAGASDTEFMTAAPVIVAAKIQLRARFKGDINSFHYEVEHLQ